MSLFAVLIQIEAGESNRVKKHSPRGKLDDVC